MPEYILDVLWGQRIKLIQVALNSELRENQWKDHLFFEIVPSHCFGASEASTIDSLKDYVWKFWTKIFNSSLKNEYFGALIFQDIEFFEHVKYSFKTSWPPKISIFKKHFTAKITLILKIKKMPLIFLDVEK